MSDQINDSRATDFVFGELSPAESKQFELELEQSPALQAEVESIREAVLAVRSELQADSRGVGEAGRRRIEVAIAGGSVEPSAAVNDAPKPAAEGGDERRKLIAFAVAASVLVMGVLVMPALRRLQLVDRIDPAAAEPSAAVSANRIDTIAAADQERALAETSSEHDDSAFLVLTAPESGKDSQQDELESFKEAGQGDAARPSEADAKANQQQGQLDAGKIAIRPTEKAEPLAATQTGPAPGGTPTTRYQGDQAMSGAAVGRADGGGLGGGAAGDSGAAGDIRESIDVDGLMGQPIDSKMSSPAAHPFGNGPTPQAMSPAEALQGEFPDTSNELGTVPARGNDRRATADGPATDQPATDRLRLRNKQAGGELDIDALGIGSAEDASLQEAHPGIVDETKLNLSIAAIDARAESQTRGGAQVEAKLRRWKEVDKQIVPQQQSGADAAFGMGPGMGGDQHDPITDNPFLKVNDAPLSTFSIDVDTASYSKVRMYLMQHQMLPRPDAVRIEELVNYFTYDYTPPAESDEHPFAANVSIGGCPWNGKHRLARVAIKGKEIKKDRPASNLVFLLDVSGSMNQPNKLPLVIEGMKMLTKQLGENDMVAIVVYAGAAGMVLDSTCGDDKETIRSALERLRAGGSTNGGQGIQLAYQTARDHFISGGTNRVILCTDGDFNVGLTGTDQLVRIAEENAKGDIFLTVLGFGMGNHNDAMMEQISNKGNGNYAFIDNKQEAEKVLVEEIGGTLVTIAKDVKIQVEFNPREVAAYRLIGYENRILAAQDFNDDKKDAGEIGAGHTVTALYELIPVDAEIDVPIPVVDDLRYLKKARPSKEALSGELLDLKLRYKQPTGTESTLIEVPVKDEGKSFSAMDADFKFAAAVAAFGMMLRKSPHKGDATFAAVEEIAGDGLGQDKHGRRAEFLEMVRKAEALSAATP